ncbi:hypothetical protein NC651_038694 [Populus alba x Populus x berolinensis]|nr:hypothetical protein NC651_038694 [Populus alba x Populus x berolinensis]
MFSHHQDSQTNPFFYSLGVLSSAAPFLSIQLIITNGDFLIAEAIKMLSPGTATYMKPNSLTLLMYELTGKPAILRLGLLTNNYTGVIT